MTLSLINWNVQRASARPRKNIWQRDGILNGINAHCPDIVCLTEADIRMLSKDGCTIYPQIDRASERQKLKNQRKVLLWSREPWKEVDCVGHDSLLPGRFISGVTETSLGEVTVAGVCIPWDKSPGIKGSGVKRWEHHSQYLDILKGVLYKVLEQASGKRLIVMGDWNQVIGPGKGLHAPDDLRQKLWHIFPPSMSIVTSTLVFRGRGSIDHIALSEDLTANALSVIDNITEDGKCLSDHFGIAATVGVQD